MHALHLRVVVMLMIGLRRILNELILACCGEQLLCLINVLDSHDRRNCISSAHLGFSACSKYGGHQAVPISPFVGIGSAVATSNLESIHYWQHSTVDLFEMRIQ